MITHLHYARLGFGLELGLALKFEWVDLLLLPNSF